MPDIKIQYLTEMDLMRGRTKLHECVTNCPMIKDYYRIMANEAAEHYDCYHPEDEDSVVSFWLDLYYEHVKIGRFHINKESVWSYRAKAVEG